MSESNNLYELISSMSKSEKAYYKRYLSIRAKDKEGNYKQLFDAFAKAGNENVGEIKKNIANSSILKHFPSYRGHLYNSILKCLRTYHSHESEEATILETLLNAIILKDKGLKKQSDKMLINAKKLAKESEELVSLLKVFDLQQKNTYQSLEIGSLQMQVMELYPSLDELMENIEERNIINSLFDKTVILYMKYGENTTDKNAIDALHKIVEDPMLAEGRVYRMKETLNRVFSLKTFLFTSLGNYEALRRNLELFLSAVENDPKYANGKMKFEYVNILSNKIYVCGVFKDLKGVEESFAKLRMINADSIKEEIKLFYALYGNTMDAFIHCNAIEKGLKIIPEVATGLKKYEKKIPLEHLFASKTNIAIIYFMAGDYSNSLKWIREIISSSEKIVREDIHIAIKNLEILVHYELKNFVLIESLMHSLRRQLLKNKRHDVISKILLNYMKKLLYVMDKEEIRKIFISFHKDMDKALGNVKNERSYILVWINRHLSV